MQGPALRALCFLSYPSTAPTILTPIGLMRKLRHRDVSALPKVTQPKRGKTTAAWRHGVHAFPLSAPEACITTFHRKQASTGTLEVPAGRSCRPKYCPPLSFVLSIPWGTPGTHPSKGSSEKALRFF